MLRAPIQVILKTLVLIVKLSFLKKEAEVYYKNEDNPAVRELIRDFLQSIKHWDKISHCPLCQPTRLLKIYDRLPFYHCPVGHSELKLILGILMIGTSRPFWLITSDGNNLVSKFHLFYYTSREDFLEVKKIVNPASNKYYICLAPLG